MSIFKQEVQDYQLPYTSAGIEELLAYAMDEGGKEKEVYICIGKFMCGDRLPLETLICDLSDDLIKIKNERRRLESEAESTSEDAYFNCTSRV